MPGQNGITKRGAMTEIAGDKEAGDLLFRIVHERFEPAKSKLVLRNGFGKDGDLLEARLLRDTKDPSQVGAHQLDQKIGSDKGQARRTAAPYVSCEGYRAAGGSP